ncbi:LOW QUALITY PROTEIN: hypothetical protein CRUP_021105, partial [Coryphaenoides rupestris]
RRRAVLSLAVLLHHVVAGALHQAHQGGLVGRARHTLGHGHLAPAAMVVGQVVGGARRRGGLRLGTGGGGLVAHGYGGGSGVFGCHSGKTIQWNLELQRRGGPVVCHDASLTSMYQTPRSACQAAAPPPPGPAHHLAHHHGGGGQVSVPEGVAGAPNEAALVGLMERTGYDMVQENGQRKYAPPPGWEGQSPPRGCEIFVGQDPAPTSTRTSWCPSLNRWGRIYEMRLMMDFDGKNRGYAFVMYTQKHEAKRAVRELNNYEVRPGRLLGVCLLRGQLPASYRRHPQDQEARILEEGVQGDGGACWNVIVYASAADKMKNRGFAFVEYESHPGGRHGAPQADGPAASNCGVTRSPVDWAGTGDRRGRRTSMETVKILYVRNLMMETSEETLRKVFGQVRGARQEDPRLRLRPFTSRDDAVLAMDHLNGTEVEGSCIEVTLAKPVDKEQYTRYQKASKGSLWRRPWRPRSRTTSTNADHTRSPTTGTRTTP